MPLLRRFIVKRKKAFKKKYKKYRSQIKNYKIEHAL